MNNGLFYCKNMRWLFLLCCGIFFSCGKNVTINQKNFPDDAFREAICCYLDVSEGETVPKQTLEAMTFLHLSGLNIKDLKGIEFFNGIEKLYCGDNLLTEVDLSHNPALKEIELIGNRLERLDFTHNPLLQELGCSYNQLTSIDVSGNPELIVLLANGNPSLESVDVSHNPQLKRLGVNYCKLKTLDVSNNPDLEELYCKRNKFTELDLTHNDKMKNLVYDMPSFGKLNITRPEGKPDLGKGNTHSWSNQLGIGYASRSSESIIVEKHKQLTKGREQVIHKVPFDSLEFEKGMHLMEEQIAVLSRIKTITPADSTKYITLFDKYEFYPEVIFSPNIHDSLTRSQRIRFYQKELAFFDEFLRLDNLAKGRVRNDLHFLGDLDDPEMKEMREIVPLLRAKLEEEIEKLKEED